MKILCKDKKILELDNTFLSFSKTLVAMQKYSNNQIVKFNFCNSYQIKIIQEWIFHSYFRFQDIDQYQSIQCHSFDKNFFNSIKKDSKNIIIIQLYKLADFLNIKQLVFSLANYIGMRLIDFSPEKINNFLNIKGIRKELKEKIFYIICKRRMIHPFQKFSGQKLFCDKKKLHPRINNYFTLTYNNFLDKNLNNLSNESKLSLRYFKVLDSLNGHFLLFEKNESIIKDFRYPKINLNLIFDKKIFYDLFPEYIEDAFLAGGIFSSYSTQNNFFQNLLYFKNHLEINQDYNIYFCDQDFQKYEFYKSKFDINVPYSNNFDQEDYEGCKKKFKFKYKNYYFNLNFINSKKYLKTIANTFKTYDYDITKIFYSFRVQKTFLYYKLFNILKEDCGSLFLDESNTKMHYALIESKNTIKKLQKLKEIVNFLQKYIKISSVHENINSFKSKFLFLADSIKIFPLTILREIFSAQKFYF